MDAPGPGLRQLLDQVKALAAGNDDASLDGDASFPGALLERAKAIGLLTAPLPVEHGGHGLATEPRQAAKLCDLLRAAGTVVLSFGRIFEGHVNALALICRFGQPAQVARFARDAWAGHLFGVWNIENSDGLRLVDGQLLEGRCSPPERDGSPGRWRRPAMPGAMS